MAKRVLTKALVSARRQYGGRANVLGVGVGTKLKDGQPTDVHDSVQFFVQHKTKSRARTKAPLPRYLWVQEGQGKQARRRKVVTDVIEVGRVDFACRAGDQIATTGKTGVATLVFRNKIAGDPGFYLVTCAHVVGALNNPQTNRKVTGKCCADGNDGALARTVAMTGIEGGRVRYDIAIARLTGNCEPQPDCEVAGESSPVRRFVKASTIFTGMTVRMALRGELNLTGGVVSLGTVEVGGIPVENLCLTNIPVRFGDSGSLVYRNDAAVGILVARSESDGFGWFQPLGDALAHAAGEEGIDIKCFDN